MIRRHRQAIAAAPNRTAWLAAHRAGLDDARRQVRPVDELAELADLNQTIPTTAPYSLGGEGQ